MLAEIEKEKQFKQVDPEASTQLDVPRDSPQGAPKRILIYYYKHFGRLHGDAKGQLCISKLRTLLLRLNKAAQWKLDAAARVPMNTLT